jgi:hypothetical protein
MSEAMRSGRITSCSSFHALHSSRSCSVGFAFQQVTGAMFLAPMRMTWRSSRLVDWTCDSPVQQLNKGGGWDVIESLNVGSEGGVLWMGGEEPDHV